MKTAITFFVAAFFVCMPHARAASGDPQAVALAEQIAERRANEGRMGRMHFTLRNASNRTRKRSAVLIHSEMPEAIKIAIFFTDPGAIRDTAFLSHDYRDKADLNWLYLPATERVRRLPSSDQSDYFMGTDLTFGDVKNDFKFAMEEWVFTETGTAERDGRTFKTLKGKAVSPQVVKEIGYSRFEALVDPQTLFPTKLTYWDGDGEALKTLHILKQDKVGEAWTAMHFTVENVQTGHRTDVTLNEMRYVPDLDPEMLLPAALAYGAPRLN